MSSANQQLFELITHNTIQNRFVHSVLIVVDYFPILISSLMSVTKIMKYNRPLSEVDEKFNTLQLIYPYRYQNNGILSSKIMLIFFCLISFFLILYHLLIFLFKKIIVKRKNSKSFETKKKYIEIIMKIIINFYDLFFMRYFTSYVCLFLTNLIIYYLFENTGSSHTVYALLFVIVYVFYAVSVFNHLNTYFTIIQISNEAISKDKGKYPFDIIYSLGFDNLLFVLKLIVSIEYNYTNWKKKIDLFSVGMNLLTIGILLVLSLKYSFQVTSYKKLDNYIFNKSLNLVRMFITIFNCYFIILSTIFIDKNTHLVILLFLFVICIIWGFFTILLIWLLLIKPRFFDGSITLQKLLYIMVQSKKESSIVLTSGESFFNVNIIKLQDSIEFHHRLNCLEFQKCILCKKYTNKQPVTAFDLYKYIIKKHGDDIIHSEIDILYRDLIKLFYYHIKKKIYKFYSWYRKIYMKFDKTDKTVVNNLSYIITLCLSYYDSFNVSTFQEIFQFSNLNQMIINHLTNIKDFIMSPNELKYVDKFFNLAKNINKLRDYQLYVLQHVELKDDYSTNCDLFTKNIKNIYKYNLLLNRYIVESLTNHRYRELNELNLDLFDEYLNTHYNTDKLLMFYLNLSHEHGGAEIRMGGDNNSYKILKCGKELITYNDKTFSDMLAKKFRKYGIEHFTSSLNEFIDYDTLEFGNDENIDKAQGNNSNINYNSNINASNFNNGQLLNNNKDKKNKHIMNSNSEDNAFLFQFIIHEKYNCEEISLFNYNFKISRSLINENLLIYGHYSGLNTKIMLFQMNKLTDTNNVNDSLNMKLENFSIGIKNIFMLNPEWLEILDKANSSVYFNTLFRTYKVYKKKDNLNDDTDINTGNTNDNSENIQFECVLNYNHYIKNISRFAKILKEFLDNEMTNNNNNNNILNKPGQLNEIEENIKKLKEKKDKTLTLKLKLLFDINISLTKSYKLFSVKILSTNSKKKNTSLIDASLNNDQNEYYSKSSHSQSQDLKQNMTYTASNTSMTENSIGLKLSQKSTQSGNHLKNANDLNGAKVDNISKTFETFSVLIVILSGLIISVCIIFLIVQINQINDLKKINNLYYEFKRIRIAFAHSFLSVFTNGCLAKLKSKECDSAYNTYSEELIVNSNYNKNYNVRNYLLAEIKYKINDMQSTFYSFKEDVFAYGDDYLLTTLSDEMIFTSFEQKDNQLIQQSLSVSLDEGFRKYINSFSVLISNDFTNAAIYIITYRNGKVSFENMETQNLSEVQTQIYLILINYINYSTIFMNSENKLETKYNGSVTKNKTVLIIFMIIIAFLNLGLLILCLWNISIVTTLFLNFIVNMIMIMSDNDFKAYYSERIDNLIELSKLYEKNPNELLHRIKKDEIKVAKKIQDKNKKLKSMEQQALLNGDRENLLVQKEQKMKEKKRNIYVDVSKIKLILLPYIYKVCVFFTIYFVIIIVFDYYLFNKFSNMLTINDYILNNFLVETQMYDVLVLTQIMTLLNLTQNDFANSLGIENIDEDGVINMKIRETASYIKEIQNQETNAKESFSSISNFFNNKKCSEIYRNIENNLTANTVQELGIDYYDLQGLLCEKFEIMSLDSFEYMFNDYLLRVQKLQNLITDYSYDSLYEFNTQYEFFDLVTMILMTMQPIRNYMRTVLMDNLMNSTINDFVVLIVIYLCVNILLNILMYLLIKFFIAGQLNKMHKELLMLNDCFSY